MRWHGALLAGWVLACAGSGTGGRESGGEPSPQPIHLIPDTSRYRVASYVQVEQEIGGQTQTSDLALVYFLTARVQPHAGGLWAELRLDSIPRYQGSAAVHQDVTHAVGARFTGTLGASGDLGNFSTSDTVNRFVREVAEEIRQFFPRVPAAGLQAGHRWTDTTTQQSTTSGVPLTIHSVADRWVTGPADHAGRRVLPIESRTSYVFSGTGQQGGQSFQVDGAGGRHAVEFVTFEGRYLGATIADSSTFSITVSATGATIPGRQTRADTVSVVP